MLLPRAEGPRDRLQDSPIFSAERVVPPPELDGGNQLPAVDDGHHRHPAERGARARESSRNRPVRGPTVGPAENTAPLPCYRQCRIEPLQHLAELSLPARAICARRDESHERVALTVHEPRRRSGERHGGVHGQKQRFSSVPRLVQELGRDSPTRFCSARCRELPGLVKMSPCGPRRLPDQTASGDAIARHPTPKKIGTDGSDDRLPIGHVPDVGRRWRRCTRDRDHARRDSSGRRWPSPGIFSREEPHGQDFDGATAFHLGCRQNLPSRPAVEWPTIVDFPDALYTTHSQSAC
jgi:hypothetical protein